MKQAILLASLAASFILVGCASKSANTDMSAQPAQQEQAPAHHDLKGEVGSAK